MSREGYTVYDPLRDEWAAPFPAALPMTAKRAEAAIHPTEPGAVMHGRQLVGSDHPWLIVQPVCHVCGGIA